MRAIHLSGQYNANGIGTTLPLYKSATPDVENPAGGMFLTASPQRPNLVEADAGSFLFANYHPIAITPQQWHFLNYRVRNVQFGGFLDFSSEPLTPKIFTNTLAASLVHNLPDERYLLKSPGLFVKQYYTVERYHSLSIGIPTQSVEFGDLSEYYPYVSDTLPFVHDSVIRHNNTNHGFTQDVVAAYFLSNNTVAPFIWFERAFDAGYGSYEYLTTYQNRFTGVDHIDTGFFLNLFDWPSIPLYLVRTPSAETDGYNINDNITLSATTYWSYDGVFDPVTGVQLQPIPTTL